MKLLTILMLMITMLSCSKPEELVEELQAPVVDPSTAWEHQQCQTFEGNANVNGTIELVRITKHEFTNNGTMIKYTYLIFNSKGIVFTTATRLQRKEDVVLSVYKPKCFESTF